MQAASSIYIREDRKTQLNNLKRNPKESYNDVIERLVKLIVDDIPLSADHGYESADCIHGSSHRHTG
jgi:predicted CopG family antitoxin